MRLNVVDIRAPHAAFTSKRALCEHRDVAQAYEHAVIAYATDPSEAGAIYLWEALGIIGFCDDEVEWHVLNPGQFMKQGFA